MGLIWVLCSIKGCMQQKHQECNDVIRYLPSHMWSTTSQVIRNFFSLQIVRWCIAILPVPWSRRIASTLRPFQHAGNHYTLLLYNTMLLQSQILLIENEILWSSTVIRTFLRNKPETPTKRIVSISSVAWDRSKYVSWHDVCCLNNLLNR